jgi:hypothetical protein
MLDCTRKVDVDWDESLEVPPSRYTDLWAFEVEEVSRRVSLRLSCQPGGGG